MAVRFLRQARIRSAILKPRRYLDRSSLTRRKAPAERPRWEMHNVVSLLIRSEIGNPDFLPASVNYLHFGVSKLTLIAQAIESF